MNTDTTTTDSVTRLPTDLARVILRAQAWWTPPIVPRRGLTLLTVDAEDLSAGVAEASVENGRLAVSHTKQTVPFSTHLLHGKLDATASDGWTLRGQGANIKAAWAHENLTRTFRVFDWRMDAPQGASSIWVGDLQGQITTYLGNLTLKVELDPTTQPPQLAVPPSSMRRSWSRGHYLFRGVTCDYAIVKSNASPQGHLLFVHAREGQIERRVLRRELTTIATSLGAPFVVPTLYAVDENIQVSAILGEVTTERHQVDVPAQPLVPISGDLSAQAVELFRCTSRWLAEAKEADANLLLQSCWYYLESMAERTAESQLLKIVYASVTLANVILGPSAHGERPARRIERALDRQGLTISRDLKPSLAVARAILNGDGPASEWNSHYQRLRMIYGALLSRVVGYRGDLLAWPDAEGHEQLAAEDWWLS